MGVATKQIKDDERKALNAWVSDCGSYAAAAKLVQLDRTQISRYARQETEYATDENWAKIEPHIRKYLTNPPEPKHEVALDDHNRVRAVPVLGMAAAAGYEPAVEPWDDFVVGASHESMDVLDAQHNWFALVVEGDSMCPTYPPGTRLIVAGGEFPQRGDIVVARIAEDGAVVVKRYSRKDSVIRLESINPAGRSYEWHIKDKPGYVVWMWPVIKAEVELRRQRWETQRAGL